LFDQGEFRHAITQRLHDFITVFFLPIFFTYTGLRTDIGSMRWLPVVVAVGSGIDSGHGRKILWMCCHSPPERTFVADSCSVGNTHEHKSADGVGGSQYRMELGLIPRSVFFMLVVMAVSTTYVTAPS